MNSVEPFFQTLQLPALHLQLMVIDGKFSQQDLNVAYAAQF